MLVLFVSPYGTMLNPHWPENPRSMANTLYLHPKLRDDIIGLDIGGTHSP